VKLRHVQDGSGGHYGYTFCCPGCDCPHTIKTEPYPNGWGFDGNQDAPTFTPSILVYPSQTLDDAGQVVATPRCHSFVRAGRIEFLSDSTHKLSGQTVELPDIVRR
jgi:hypothetical protein